MEGGAKRRCRDVLGPEEASEMGEKLDPEKGELLECDGVEEENMAVCVRRGVVHEGAENRDRGYGSVAAEV